MRDTIVEKFHGSGDGKTLVSLLIKLRLTKKKKNIEKKKNYIVCAKNTISVIRNKRGSRLKLCEHVNFQN